MQDFLKLTNTLWESANNLRTNSSLSLKQFSEPVLGLIFLKFADVKFQKTVKILEQEQKENEAKYGRAKPITEKDYIARGVIYLPEPAQFSYLINQSEGSDIGKALNDAMKLIEENNHELKGILPKSYTGLTDSVLINLLRNFNQIPDNIEGDVFGMIYEYFLGKFALSEWQGGGEFFTPTSLVKLIVNILEPFKGRIFDPACGSGGMFVQSAEFVKNNHKNISDVAIYGQEKTGDTLKIAKMNLALHGLSGDIREWLTHINDLHNSVGQFDFVMANPPFRMTWLDQEKLKTDPRYPFWVPSVDNGNYLWIQIFYSTLNTTGRAGFVMANSASDARNSEGDIKKALIEDNVVDVMVSVGKNMFFNVTLPCTLWFLDKGKKNTLRKDTILFLDIRNIFRQIDRAHRELTEEQIQYISNIARLYRWENIVDFEKFIDTQIEIIKEKIEEFGTSRENKVIIQTLEERIKIAEELKISWETNFKDGYQDILWLCKVATIEAVKNQWYSLNSGRYVWVTDWVEEDFVFEERIEGLSEELITLTQESHKLEEKIIENIGSLFLKK
jgi:type I restriction enzyme M protein